MSITNINSILQRAKRDEQKQRANTLKKKERDRKLKWDENAQGINA